MDTEVRREAEVIRQVRESETEADVNILPSQTTTSSSSPSLLATTVSQADNLEEIPEDAGMKNDLSSRRTSSTSSTFNQQALKNSAGLGFWNAFDERMRTPPPAIGPRGSSSSEDVNMDTPMSSVQSATPQQNNARAQHLAGDGKPALHQLATNTTDLPKKGTKRMREDDFEPNFFKRRGVSPALSLQNSPIMPQSPLQRDNGWWGGPPRASREGSFVQVGGGERASSGGSAGSANGGGASNSGTPAKRVGLQGMTDTHDGLMNMSIE